MPSLTKSILKSLHGQAFGLAADGTPIVNRQQALMSRTAQVDAFDVTVVTITSAELLALNATPKVLIEAPGAGYAIIPHRALLHKPAGTAYAGIAAGEDLRLAYTSSPAISVLGEVETTGFLDQTTEQTRIAYGASHTAASASVAVIENDSFEINLETDEITTGDSDLIVTIWSEIIEYPPTA